MRLLYLWGPVLAHMALIFAGSSRQDTSGTSSQILDKVVHFAVYAVLGALILRALAGGRRTGITWSAVVLSVVIATLYGITDEWHQSFVPTRSPDAMDVIADLVGAAAGSVSTAITAGRSGAKAPTRST